jgi:S1-C subfamily serine protease
MTALDWFALAFVVLAALGGAVQGFVWSALSLAGLVAGALIGGRLASVLLSNGPSSGYAPLVALACAVGLAVAFEVGGRTLGAVLRGRQSSPEIRALDSAGGVVAGALVGLSVVWVLGAMALQLPGQADLRRAAQRSDLLRGLNSIVPPRTLLTALRRVDPFQSIAGPPVPAEPLDPRVLSRPGVRASAPSVVKVLGTACGLGIEGTGWVAKRGLVVTAAHVVAGEHDTSVVTLGGTSLPAHAVAFDPKDDIAVLRVPGLSAGALRLVDPRPGAAVAIEGYPENGPFGAVPGRIGMTATVVAPDAYGKGPVARTVTSVSGAVRHGDSGGPAVDATGAVQATMFAARSSGGGYGVPAAVVRGVLASIKPSVSTGPCAA